jgi:hypothetical protein
MAVYRPSRDRVVTLLEQLGPGPWPRAELLVHGWSQQQLERAVTAGILQRVRRGMYALPTAEVSVRQLAIPFDSDRARMRALVPSLNASSAFSHDSAAHVHRQWNPHAANPLIHVTIPGQAEREDAGVRVHGSRLPSEFVTTVDGLRVTTVARTAVDLARGSDLSHALVAVDGALRTLVGAAVSGAARRLRERTVPLAVLADARAMLDDAFAVVWSWPGSIVVRDAIALADPCAESPFESWSRAWILRSGLPRPEVNVPVFGGSGRTYYGDFVWRRYGLIGEADGVGKYGETAPAIRSALSAERERHADLEAGGWRVIRWVTGDPGRSVVARVGRALYLEAPPAARILGLEA